MSRYFCSTVTATDRLIGHIYMVAIFLRHHTQNKATDLNVKRTGCNQTLKSAKKWLNANISSIK